ncbi:MAG: glucose-1-phosphate adenylyltransferase [Planctomycetales bacterium]|nr:glucose-1-phosphate adenylyltransferase [Planctomycetales bacterium]
MIQEGTIALLLAGGVGSRLHPLTENRAKPAVPFGGKYRIIDFTLSNCYYSGLRRILVLTQYKSQSLQKHLRDGWSIFNPGIGEYITSVPPQMRTGDSWYAGTADAVYQNLYMLERSGAERVIILSGDHIYRMDYAAMDRFHRKSSADATIACMKVPVADAQSFGVMSVDDDGRIVNFHEKPANPQPIPGDPHHALASMGIYIFNLPLLCRVLREDHTNAKSSHDFGKDILPTLIRSHNLYGYEFGTNGGRVRGRTYWRDVGTLDSYFDTHMDLLKPNPPLDLYQHDWAIRTSAEQGPPVRTAPGASGKDSVLANSMSSSGVVITGGVVRTSILSRNVRIDDGADVQNSILLDGVRVAAGAVVRNCIIDKDVRIPPGERIGYDLEIDRKRFTVTENGIVVVPSSYRFNRRPATIIRVDSTSEVAPVAQERKSTANGKDKHA